MAKKIKRISDIVSINETQGQFILMGRAEFLKWLKTMDFKRYIKGVQQHHTYIPNYDNFDGDNHFYLCQSMKRSHLNRGFSDIAQNLTTFPDGTIMVCRDFEKKPVGIKGKNTGYLCIEHVGYFDEGKDEITNEHNKTILFLTALLLDKFGLETNTESVLYHHWFASKSCPGTAFYGGNTIEACKANFLPRIESMRELLNEK